MRWFLAVAAIAACSKPRPTVPLDNLDDDQVGSMAGLVAGRYCPHISAVDHWLHELFPDCPPSPVLVTYPYCEGDCPQPCRSTSSNDGMGVRDESEASYEYDPAGHWIKTTSTGAYAYSYGCAWVGDRVDRCTGYDGEASVAIRDPAGALVAITVGTTRYDIGRDGNGAVVQIGGTRISYDGRHRIEQVGDTVVGYDDAGRVESETTPRDVARWKYDDQGRLLSVVIKREGQSDRRLIFRRDDQGRLEAITSGGSLENDSATTSFQYQCVPPPTP